MIILLAILIALVLWVNEENLSDWWLITKARYIIIKFKIIIWLRKKRILKEPNNGKRK